LDLTNIREARKARYVIDDDATEVLSQRCLLRSTIKPHADGSPGVGCAMEAQFDANKPDLPVDFELDGPRHG
jgi:hypothetical protein